MNQIPVLFIQDFPIKKAAFYMLLKTNETLRKIVTFKNNITTKPLKLNST
jgi:hypothetical protein